MTRLRDAPTNSGRPNILAHRAAPAPSGSARASCRSRCRGSSTILSREIPASLADRERTRKECGHVLHNVDAGLSAVAIVHDDDGQLAGRQQACHVGIALQAPDVRWRWSHPRRAPRPQRPISCCRWRRDPERDGLGQYRSQSLQLFLGRDRFGTIGPGRFRANVDDVGAFGDHAPGLRPAPALARQTGHHRKMSPA